jgi:hypothetical protein
MKKEKLVYSLKRGEDIDVIYWVKWPDKIQTLT